MLRAFQMMLQMKAHHLCSVLVLRFKEKKNSFPLTLVRQF